MSFLIILFVGHFVKHILVYLTCIFLAYLCLGREEREIRAKYYLTILVHSLWYPCYNQEMAEILIWNCDLVFPNSSHFACNDYLYIRKCSFKKMRHPLQSCFKNNMSVNTLQVMRLHCSWDSTCCRLLFCSTRISGRKHLSYWRELTPSFLLLRWMITVLVLLWNWVRNVDLYHLCPVVPFLWASELILPLTTISWNW
jgi:hypothetical protein